MKKICLVLAILLLFSGCNVVRVSEEGPLPVVGSAETLMKLLKSRQQVYRGVVDYGAVNEALAPTADKASGHSTTNIQVQGIDEGDVVKTDGSYLYHIAGNKVLITRAWPVSSLEIAREIQVDGFFPSTLYVDDKYLVVIGGQTVERPRQPEGADYFLPWMPANTRVMVYDLTDKDNIRLCRDFSLDGYTVTSRKKDNYLYLVNSQYTFRIMEDGKPQLPWYKDSADGGKETVIGYDEICYFPDGEVSDYIMFAALDLEGDKLEVDTYLGWAQNIYMSLNYLYIALTEGHAGNTSIYRFAVDGIKMEYKGKGTVAGYPLNQFSMDEHEGHFRIATTEHKEDGPVNNVYVLDDKMGVAGEIRGLAPGETIYAARFMGDRGYLVTFEMMDPLFAIDLSNPKKPKVLGELKIPGFSNYLHPLDDKHLLGLGQDTVISEYEGREFVVTKGLKLAIFDVSDINNPREEHAVVLGDSGSWSEALYDHKAVFYYQEVLAIPASLTKGNNWEANLVFQGALFFDIDLTNGIRELGRIAHTATGSQEEGMFYWTGANIRRIVQIEDVYYTVSDCRVMAHNADNFEKLAEIELPQILSENYWR